MRYIYIFLLSLAALCNASVSSANHIYGADLYYEYVSGYTYRINLAIYGDCKGPSFPYLNNARPEIQIRNNGSIVANINLTQSGAGAEVTPVCAAEQNNTSCKNPANTLPGVTRYIYTALYTLPYPYTSASWVFRFTGGLPSPTAAMGKAGRSQQLTNISAGGTSIMILDAALNNTIGANSSPTFTTLPTPFICLNVPEQYNQGSVDVDHDSLVYALAPGLEATGYVSYNSGYSATSPLAVSAGTFSFNSATGQMNFTPNTTQQSLVVNQVSEYRHGVLVGSASREMTFVVLSNCNTTPATNAIDSTIAPTTSGGITANATTFNVCKGTDSVHFNILARNPGNDTIVASVTGLPTGAIATIAQNNTLAPVVTIDWKPSSAPAGTYNFFVTYKDDGCPLTTQQTQAYTIQVIEPNIMSTTIAAPTQCVHRALVHYNFANGLLPRNVTIAQGGNIIDTFTDHNGSVLDSLAVGVYTVSISSPKLPCVSSFSLRIVDSGIYPNTPLVTSPVFYCKNDQAITIHAQPDSGAIVHWYSAQGALLGAPPTPRTDTTGIFTWYLSQRFKVCESLRDSVKVYVTQRPVAGIAGPATICLSDTAIVSFNGSIGAGPILDYIWNWGDAGYVSGQDAGPWRVHWYGPGKKTIKLRVEENRCSSLEVEKNIIVKPIPYAGFITGSEVCQYDTLRVLYNRKPAEGQLYSWNFAGANVPASEAGGPFVLRWDTAGVKRISLTVDLDGCKDVREADITVHPVPDLHIVNVPAPVCIGDKIYLSATGGATYAWSPQDSLNYTPDGKLYAQILKPTVYKVTAITQYGCIDSASVSYKVVEPCCNFSYPNAFTPNGDGHNDRFRIVTYGNQKEFELSIYNQWGQRVYYGVDAQQGWDGTFGGKPCAAGSYFYYLNARCFTGHQETQKGDLMLIR